MVNCFNDRWYEGWLERNWRNAQRKPVANRDLWEPLVELFRARRGELSFVWVKAHAGDEMNELVDQMAVAQSLAWRDGGDAGSAPAGPLPPWPIDQAVVVTGVAEPDADQVAGLADAVAGLDPGHDLLITGLRRGVELLAGELAVAGGVTLGVVLPFADPAARWPRADLDRFEACLGRAEWVVTLDGDRSKPGVAIAARNAWLWEAAVGAIVVGDEGLVDQLDERGLGVVPVA